MKYAHMRRHTHTHCGICGVKAQKIYGKSEQTQKVNFGTRGSGCTTL